ncbi:hypothetical protein B0H16DRAFT_1826473 [Mycena metata]|uniref:Uncharacterized protein n=1 Tax=Mycena metata TaxID=1033252 RepID=A0AAD7M8J9_9AGAR|nr:hypothetical protein B0H16DRAFT_1826473 [Mycena metata]
MEILVEFHVGREGVAQAVGGVDTVWRKVYEGGGTNNVGREGVVRWGARKYAPGSDYPNPLLRRAASALLEKAGQLGGGSGGGRIPAAAGVDTGWRLTGESASWETGGGCNERERQFEGGIVAVACVLTLARDGSVREGRETAGRVGVGGKVGVAREWDVGARRARRWVLDAKGGVVGSTGGVRASCGGVLGCSRGGECGPVWAGCGAAATARCGGSSSTWLLGRGVWCGDAGDDVSALFGDAHAEVGAGSVRVPGVKTNVVAQVDDPGTTVFGFPPAVFFVNPWLPVMYWGVNIYVGTKAALQDLILT